MPRKKGSGPESEIVMQDVADLTPAPRNPRTHSEEQLDQLVASLKEFGFTNPILVDEEGMILAGHGRREAALRLGLKTVPTIIAKNWTEAQKKAYIIADNKLALMAGWDIELLKFEIHDLQEMNFDIRLTGFNEGEIYEIFKGPDFGPGDGEEQGRLDQLEPKWVKCPHCGEDFDLRENG